MLITAGATETERVVDETVVCFLSATEIKLTISGNVVKKQHVII